ncbi:DUF6268 family outer membrane beta-barrel protein [Saccharophagus degradans]|uniref:DUF6268 family outer membrane beta-barrel protein n=1 Tax=Saccharophagus degradans TaxID=86304 RepID=UPI002477CBE3|nr:DUF6268 family outer membrane beta-barrel protein [Saccharophagus degradans]WGO97863.1 DUF6268 family outer membrane beta-barrel protein [Saccharophagus degradans]
MKYQKYFRRITSFFVQPQTIITSIICISLFNTASADTLGPGFNVNIQHIGASQLEKLPNLSFEMTELRLNAPLMSLDTNSGKLFFGVNYINTELNISEKLFEKTLHNLEIPITLVQDRYQWNVVYQIAPAINSDLEEISKDDFSINGKIIANYKTGLGNFWTVGLSANRLFGEPRIYPVLGYHMKSLSHWDLRFSVPNPELSYLPLDSMRLSLYGAPHGGEWNIYLKDDTERNEWNTSYSGYQFGFRTLLRSQSKHWASFTLGREFNRSGSFLDQDGMEYEVDFDNENFIAVSFGREF